MGRAERRRSGNTAKVKTYTLTDVQIRQIKKEAADKAYDMLMQSAEAEINRQIIENDKKYTVDLDATIMYTLHEHFGFGRIRLRRFWDAFIEDHKELRERYGAGYGPQKCIDELLRIGVDVEAWNAEFKEEYICSTNTENC